MGRQMLKYFAGLVGLYIVVAYASNFGSAFGSVASGVSNVTATLQGRSGGGTSAATYRVV